jgi:hypothetical protein
MGWLMPVGAGLIVLGLAGSAAACYQTAGLFDEPIRVEQPSGSTDTPLTENAETTAPMILAPLAGISLAAGILFVGVGIGHWRRPILSDTRPANPWSDQPGEHGDPPKGLV